MKQSSAIFLILLLSFHWYGYRLIIDRLQKKADHELETRLDANQYKESELIEIRTPLNMPYQNGFTEFERCYGEIIIDNVVHTYVKRRVEEGILVLKCIPNHAKQAVKNADNDFFQDNNGFGDRQNRRDNTPLVKALKNALCDCESTFHNLDLNLFSQSKCYIFFSPDIFGANPPVAGQPPDLFS